METKLAQISRVLLWHYYPAWLLFSGLYGLVFATLFPGTGLSFLRLFFESQLQVLAVFGAMAALLKGLAPARNSRRLAVAVLGVVIGVLGWEMISAAAKGTTPLPAGGGPAAAGFIGVRILSGLFVIWCFFLAERYYLSERRIRREKIRRLRIDKDLTDNEIRYLKARIDPDYLFRRLRSILALRDTHPQRARTEQLDLVRHLRRSLAETRATGKTGNAEDN